MTIRSRLWASLAVALAMMLAAGMGVAGPAAADSGAGDLAAADAAELGALLDVEVMPQPDGYIEITEYENATEITMVAADCERTVRAYKPTKSSSRVRGSGYYRISGCGTSPYEVIISIELYTNNNWVSMHSWNFTTYPPISGEPSISTPCKRGGWTTEINLLKDGSSVKYVRSDVLNVTSC
ncbi:hypothetical protein [Glycomyces terrestris]|uniref:Secreted protein n=1 Tax=Glycomyces terrestris TaxID=2493553 RepID=A0A426V3S6_9ACTN|nr:hypothetical protein [Glycomyces terrestris]RRS01502.1 hypothetical protein EIW28_01665 [Glycomyces terrestris]